MKNQHRHSGNAWSEIRGAKRDPPARRRPEATRAAINNRRAACSTDSKILAPASTSLVHHAHRPRRAFLIDTHSAPTTRASN